MNHKTSIDTKQYYLNIKKKKKKKWANERKKEEKYKGDRAIILTVGNIGL